MKKLKHSITACLIIAFAVLSFWCGGAQTNHLKVPNPEYSSNQSMPTPTNGIVGQIQVDWDRDHGRLPDIVVSVWDTNANLCFGEKYSGTNFAVASANKILSGDWLYFSGTNSFCGPIELSDKNGRKLPLLKPEVSSLAAYPASYSWTYQHFKYLSRYEVYLGPGNFPPALGFPVSPLAQFRLSDYFEIKEPGEYLLTVWPKIYRRDDEDRDLCRRVDVPPVSVTIKWEGTKAK